MRYEYYCVHLENGDTREFCRFLVLILNSDGMPLLFPKLQK